MFMILQQNKNLLENNDKCKNLGEWKGKSGKITLGRNSFKFI